VFWERGYTAGTTKDVAQRVGLSQPTIYHYVGSKTALLQDIVTDVYSTVLRSLDDARGKVDDPEQQLRAIVHSLTQAITERHEMFGVFWQEFRQLPEDLQARVREDERAFLQEIVEIVQKLQAKGQLAPDRPPVVVASSILGMVSWLYQWYRPEGDLRADAIADTFLDLLGLSAVAPTKPSAGTGRRLRA
jgi:TetR/AcrR family transcriptional regulator, cholesterol catabolism regulator